MDSIENKTVEYFVKSSINQDLAHQLVVKTLQIIPCDNSDPKLVLESKKLPSLSKFLNKLINSLNLNNGILMTTIVYLNRLKTKLPNNCKGLPSTRHRILLSCLILSIKFNNDFSLKNHDWLKLTNNLFNLKDINLMERQLLYLLNWNLFIHDLELFNTFNKFLYPIKEKLINNYRMKQYLAYHQKTHQSPSNTSSPQSVTSPQTPRSSIGSSTSSPGSDCLSPERHLQIPAYHQPVANVPAAKVPGAVPHRKSSNSSISSMSSAGSHSPLSSPIHYHHESPISVDSYESIPTKINPLIELTALNEQYELNKLLESLKHGSI